MNVVNRYLKLSLTKKKKKRDSDLQKDGAVGFFTADCCFYSLSFDFTLLASETAVVRRRRATVAFSTVNVSGSSQRDGQQY